MTLTEKVVHLMVAACCAVAPLCQAASVTVLGVPIGDNLPRPLSLCPDDTDLAKVPCWVERPFVSKSGHKLGMVVLPSPSSRPKWAAHANFNLTIDRSGRVEALKVRVGNSFSRHEVAKSIGERFGLPATSSLSQADYQTATWEAPGMFISMVCGNAEGCTVYFTTPEAEERRRQEVAGRDANRPTAP